MAWDTYENGTQLALTGSYQVVQRSAADWVSSLNPGELAQVMLTFTAESTPSENCDIVIEMSGNATLFESDGEAQREIIEFTASTAISRSITIVGVNSFRVLARLRTPTDGAGGADTGSVLDVAIRKDGVSI